MTNQGQDGLGATDRLMQHSPAELAQTIGGYREAWGDLQSLVVDLDQVGMVGDGTAHPWAPMVMHALERYMHHGHHPHHHPMSHVVQHLLARLHAVMARHVDLEREKRLWHAKSNVVQSPYWQNVPANSLSTTATVRAPYSGVNYMVLDVLMPAPLTPFGFWTNISFASINFAQSGTTISYAPPGGGVQGNPSGFGFTVFYEDKTAPEGCRGWNPWTGWILSSDAVSTWQWFNGDTAFPRSLIADILMRSSPCDVTAWDGHVAGGVMGQTIPWAGYYAGAHPGVGSHALNLLYAAALGHMGLPKGHPGMWFSGQHPAHPGNFGSIGPGLGVQPSGHGGPFGPAMIR